MSYLELNDFNSNQVKEDIWNKISEQLPYDSWLTSLLALYGLSVLIFTAGFELMGVPKQIVR